MNTIVPARRDSFTVSARPIWLPILSAPAAASRLVTSPRSTLATSQPTKPITAAPNTFGTMSSSLVSMDCTGSSSPRRSKAARMLGMNSRITSQNSTLATVRLIGSMPASFDSRSSSVRRRERAVDDRLQQGRDQPGEQHEDRARHQARRVADDLRHQLRERIRDAVQVQRVEDRHHRHEDDEPEHAERDAGLDADLLAGALLDAPCRP